MLGPSIMMVSAPVAVGYAWASLRAGMHRSLSTTALVVACLENAVLLFLLIQASARLFLD
jgi:hypothetical protein